MDANYTNFQSVHEDHTKEVKILTAPTDFATNSMVIRMFCKERKHSIQMIANDVFARTVA